MLDFGHILQSGGEEVMYYEGLSGTTLKTWHTWRKPRGAKKVYFLGVGGGSSGGQGNNSAATSGGGAGGGSGAQSCVLMPALLIPDLLYVQAGQGGIAPTTSAAVGVAGTPTYVCIEPDTTLNANFTLLYATGGLVTGAAATSTTGGAVGTAATLPTIANMPLAGRGHYNFLVGQSGSAGGADTAAGLTLNYPQTGLIVSGGTGGGGARAATATAGGSHQLATAGLGTDWYSSMLGGAAAVGQTKGNGGYWFRNYILSVGGTGGASSNSSAIAGAGGIGGPGSGGGGAGAPNSAQPTLALPGNGGGGFVFILSFF